MELIDKDALVAEIYKWKNHVLDCGYHGQGEYEDGNKQGKLDACDKFVSIINSLEVKEVDLEKIINDYFKDWKFDEELDIMVKPNNYSASFIDLKDIAKHFFELGLSVNSKAQKGE